MDITYHMVSREVLPELPPDSDLAEVEAYVETIRASTRKIKPVYRALGEVLVARETAESNWKLSRAYKALMAAGIKGTELRNKMGNLSGTTWDEVRRAAELDYTTNQYTHNDLDVIRAENKLKLALKSHRLGWSNVKTRHELILEARNTGLTKTDARWVLGISNNRYTDFDRVWDTGKLWIEN